MDTKTKIIIALFIFALVFTILTIYLNLSAAPNANVSQIMTEIPQGNPVGGFSLSIEPYTPAPGGAGK